MAFGGFGVTPRISPSLLLGALLGVGALGFMISPSCFCRSAWVRILSFPPPMRAPAYAKLQQVVSASRRQPTIRILRSRNAGPQGCLAILSASRTGAVLPSGEKRRNIYFDGQRLNIALTDKSFLSLLLTRADDRATDLNSRCRRKPTQAQLPRKPASQSMLTCPNPPCGPRGNWAKRYQSPINRVVRPIGQAW